MAAVEAPTPDAERQVLTHSADETYALGQILGRLLQPGDFVGLVGELGAGKTQFVRGVTDGAGVPSSDVASPSFAIVYPYSGRIAVVHSDFYRLANYDELYATGFLDLVDDKAAVLVEWLDKIPEAAPESLLNLRFETLGNHERRIWVQAYGERPAALLKAWLAK